MYSPFEKDLASITADDLAVLRNVSEGWFVEYKELLPSPKDIAKSVAAFANHQGGWFFVGVQESGDGRRTAAAFPGLDADAITGSIDRIRDAVRAHTDPIPHFESRVVSGPSADAAVAASKAIIIVRIRSGGNPPYIHSSGRIYRRVADSSEPKVETDRAVIDLLLDRSRQSRKQLDSFLTAEHSLSKAESNSSFLRLFFMQDPFGDRGDRVGVTFEEFADLARSPSSSPIGLVFDNVFTMSAGFVARHVGQNDPQYRLLTWEFNANGTSIFTVPLALGDPRRNSRFKFAKDFVLGLGNLRAENIVDANQFLVMLSALYGMHLAAIKKAGIAGPVLSKARLLNVRRKIPFFDSEVFLLHVRKYGVPLCQEDSALTPPGTAPESLLELDVQKPSHGCDLDGLVGLFVTVSTLFVSIMEALGIPREVLFHSSSDLYAAKIRTKISSPRPDGSGQRFLGSPCYLRLNPEKHLC